MGSGHSERTTTAERRHAPRIKQPDRVNSTKATDRVGTSRRQIEHATEAKDDPRKAPPDAEPVAPTSAAEEQPVAEEQSEAAKAATKLGISEAAYGEFTEAGLVDEDMEAILAEKPAEQSAEDAIREWMK